MRSFGLVAAVLAWLPVAAAAEPIAFYLGSTASGTLGSRTFTDAIVDYSLLTDTSVVEPVAGETSTFVTAPGLLDIYVGDAGGADLTVFTAPTTIVLRADRGAASSLSFIAGGETLLTLSGAALADYRLDGDFSATSLTLDYFAANTPFATDLGTLVFTAPATDVRFAAALNGPSVIPEPETWSLLILGFAMVGGVVRRGRRQAGGPVTTVLGLG